MKLPIIALLLLLAVSAIGVEDCRAVQPLPTGGNLIAWDRATNALSYSLWKMVPPSTNWVWLANTTSNSITYTNPIVDAFFYLGVASVNGTNQSDIGMVPWPPSLTTGAKSLRVTPLGGYKVPTNRWMKVSTDLLTFDDWLRFNLTTNGTVNVEHLVNPARPYLFISYPAVQTPPLPP